MIRILIVDALLLWPLVAGPASLDFPEIPKRACMERIIPLPGARIGDAIVPGIPEKLERGLIVTMFVGRLGAVTVRMCNVGDRSIDAAEHDFSATIVRASY